MNDLGDACRSLFERHRVEAFGGVFHVPDLERYPTLRLGQRLSCLGRPAPRSRPRRA